MASESEGRIRIDCTHPVGPNLTQGLPMRRRLYTGCADLAVARGFRKPRNRGFPKAIEGDGAFVRMYVYARSESEALLHFSEALSASNFKVLGIFDVAPNGSNKPWPMDDMFISREAVVLARQKGQVMYGWFIGYSNTEPGSQGSRGSP